MQGCFEMKINIICIAGKDKVRIKLEGLSGGYIFATSPDVAGLYLVADSQRVLFEKIPLAIKQLYKLNKGIDSVPVSLIVNNSVVFDGFKWAS